MKQKVRRAVIDIGTNSVKLLVAEVGGHQVEPVWEGSQQTRLGDGFYETHRLQTEPIARTTRAVGEFAAKARELGVERIRVLATSAARDAQNPEELVTAVQAAAGVTLEIISGEQEADLAFQGATTNPAFENEPLLLLEVGGGSTQFILGQSEQRHFRASFPLGTVRLLQHLPHSDPPRPAELAECRDYVRDFLRNEVQPGLQPAMEREVNLHAQHSPVQLIGTGGTATILARIEGQLDGFDREKIEGTQIRSMRAHVDRLWGVSLEERRKIVGLPPNRADVILPGAAVYEAVMEVFGFSVLQISTRGLRFAAV